MAGGGGDGSRELDQTPTWAVASVCAGIILISLVLEKVLHRIGEWLTERRKKALFEALEKVKAELMILGFISLLLTFGQNYIAKICIPEKTADTMLPCSLKKKETKETGKGGEDRRRLLWDFIMDMDSHRRVLAAGSSSKCADGKVPLVSVNGIHQLHIFIFFLAVFHVVYSAITMALGRAKIRGWKEWERETSSLDYEFSNDPTRFRFAHETSFVRQHTSVWNRVTFLLYIVSFFRQFFWSVRKADYLTMRNGFISAHLAPGSKFDFQKYIKRSLEDDFKVVVSISPILWASSVIFLLLNVHGWQSLFWVALIPPIIILAVGTKLQAIITQMALEIKERHVVVQGIPLVKLTDHHFWFGRPGLVLFLIHYTLFQNAFQIIYFLWIWYEFGLKSCFHENFKLIIARVCLGVGVQFLCSYVTLPLYALVSQMGSHMKRSIFDEQTSKALRKWRLAAKRRRGKSPTGSALRTPGESPSVSPRASPVHPIHRFKTTGHSTNALARSRRDYYSDQELSDAEPELTPASPSAPILGRNADRSDREPGPAEQRLQIVDDPRNPEEDFSFVKPDPV
uniref:MLO-like protein n=2 Tax=Anthurium amnicola TaxID=1678845 RepID=A0A1D1YET4_9ARAE